MTQKKALVTLIIVYLLIGSLLNAYACAFPSLGQDGAPPDIPCAGIPWTPIILFSWPLFGVFSLSAGDVWDAVPSVVGIILMLAATFILQKQTTKNATKS
ncbi:MAG: hypothetical protein HYZ09_03645 [Candidatus Kerfeldbacteria bacterium]|nr:hypothetical protein [Candidatus Kerfeldbacteria bacterium]